MHYFHQNSKMCWKCSTFGFSIVTEGVLLLWHSVECKLLPHCLSVSGSQCCVYEGFTRCWFSRWTDDRLSQQLRRQIHSPTLSTLPLRFSFACFVYMYLYLSLSRCLFFTRTISMFINVTFFVISGWHIDMDCLQHPTHSLPLAFE